MPSVLTDIYNQTDFKNYPVVAGVVKKIDLTELLQGVGIISIKLESGAQFSVDNSADLMNKSTQSAFQFRIKNNNGERSNMSGHWYVYILALANDVLQIVIEKE